MTTCKMCGKPLGLNRLAWASQDGMYCSKECGIKDAEQLYELGEYTSYLDRYHKAAAYFNDVAEEVTREDYGLVVEHHFVYSKPADVTATFIKVYDGDTLLCTEFSGFFMGQPAENMTTEMRRINNYDDTRTNAI